MNREHSLRTLGVCGRAGKRRNVQNITCSRRQQEAEKKTLLSHANASLTLEFPGIPRRRKFRVFIGNAPIDLTSGGLELLALLAHAKVTSESGLIDPAPDEGRAARQQAIHRLREAIDDALGRDAGKAIIADGGDSRYFLDEVITSIIVAPAFVEIAATTINKDILQELIRRCPPTPAKNSQRFIRRA